MSSLYTPVFPPPGPKPTPSLKMRDGSSSMPPSSSSCAQPNPASSAQAHTTLLSSIHLALSRLPPELCPPSPTTKNISLENVAKIQEGVLNAVEVSEGERSNGKWGQVGRRLTLACTRGRWRYHDALATARKLEEKRLDTGDQRPVQWVLVDTEEEWFQWEKRIQDEKQLHQGGKAAPVVDDDRGPLDVKERVKIWRQNLLVAPEQSVPLHPSPPLHPTDAVAESSPMDGQGNISLEHGRTKERQSKIVAGAQPDSSSLPQSTGSLQPKRLGVVTVRDAKDPSSLGFPVVKRSSASSILSKKPHGVPTPLSSQEESPHKPQPPQRRELPNAADPVTAPLDVPAEDPHLADIEMLGSSNSIPGLGHGPYHDMLHVPRKPTKIGDVSESQSYLPPSFPHEIETSTPNVKKDAFREKPPVITSSSVDIISSLPFASSSPAHVLITSSPLPPAPNHPNSSELPPDVPSPAKEPPLPLPLPSTPKRIVKRARDPTPLSDAMEVSSPLRNDVSPLMKKARTSPKNDTDLSPPAPPPESPPISENGLGNADGVPVPSTPHRHLPTLTELLASSRQSKPRPRPPFWKAREGELPNLGLGQDGREAGPNTGAAADVTMREKTPDPSPAKTHFSFTSPASGSQNSPASMMIPVRSPATPTFTQNPSAFAPDFVSSQAPYGVGSTLGRGSSGFLGMGYNSQFDVEGQVDRVSELLERDVDFEGWLRDIPAEDESSQREN